jgi:hypothetical protein
MGTAQTLKLTDIRADIQGETAAAYDGKTTAWVPKSQVEENGDGTWTMPLWLAQDKGFI